MRCFSDRCIVLAEEVVIDLYITSLSLCLSRNALTSLYVRCPSDETKRQIPFKVKFVLDKINSMHCSD